MYMNYKKDYVELCWSHHIGPCVDNTLSLVRRVQTQKKKDMQT